MWDDQIAPKLLGKSDRWSQGILVSQISFFISITGSSSFWIPCVTEAFLNT